MAPTVRPTPTNSASDEGLPTAAIVMIGVGAYLVLVMIFLVIRQCLKSQGISICPAWVSEMCCGSCCGGEDDTERCCVCSCFLPVAEMCDCSTPSKKSCMDSVCPTKQWCDNTFCCCMNAEPGGAMCQDCNGPECALGDCNCACNCAVPECDSINCICFKIDLSGGQAGTQQQQESIRLQQQIQQLQQLQMQQQQFELQQQQRGYPSGYPR
ncbi:hypothetical protein ABFA07_005869 [Porites harrisoni]